MAHQSLRKPFACIWVAFHNPGVCDRDQHPHGRSRPAVMCVQTPHGDQRRTFGQCGARLEWRTSCSDARVRCRRWEPEEARSWSDHQGPPQWQDSSAGLKYCKYLPNKVRGFVAQGHLTFDVDGPIMNPWYEFESLYHQQRERLEAALNGLFGSSVRIVWTHSTQGYEQCPLCESRSIQLTKVQPVERSNFDGCSGGIAWKHHGFRTALGS